MQYETHSICNETPSTTNAIWIQCTRVAHFMHLSPFGRPITSMPTIRANHFDAEHPVKERAVRTFVISQQRELFHATPTSMDKQHMVPMRANRPSQASRNPGTLTVPTVPDYKCLSLGLPGQPGQGRNTEATRRVQERRRMSVLKLLLGRDTPSNPKYSEPQHECFSIQCGAPDNRSL